MKRTNLLRRCTWISVAVAFALLWANYWAALAAFVCTGIFATLWLIYDHEEQVKEQQQRKQYFERLNK